MKKGSIVKYIKTLFGKKDEDFIRKCTKEEIDKNNELLLKERKEDIILKLHDVLSNYHDELISDAIIESVDFNDAKTIKKLAFRLCTNKGNTYYSTDEYEAVRYLASSFISNEISELKYLALKKECELEYKDGKFTLYKYNKSRINSKKIEFAFMSTDSNKFKLETIKSTIEKGEY